MNIKLTDVRIILTADTNYLRINRSLSGLLTSVNLSNEGSTLLLFLISMYQGHPRTKTIQPEYLFLTLGSLFSVLQLQNPGKICLDTRTRQPESVFQVLLIRQSEIILEF